MTALPAWRQRLAAVAVLMPHSFSVRLEPDDACWIRAPAAVMAVHESNFHAPCCEACGKEWGKTVPTAESDPFVMVLSKLHVQPAFHMRVLYFRVPQPRAVGSSRHTGLGCQQRNFSIKTTRHRPSLVFVHGVPSQDSTLILSYPK